MYCDLCLQYIKVRKLFKGGNYSRAETIRGNTVSNIFAISIVKKVKHLKIFVKSFSVTSLINKEDGINEEYGPNLLFIT